MELEIIVTGWIGVSLLGAAVVVLLWQVVGSRQWSLAAAVTFTVTLLLGSALTMTSLFMLFGPTLVASRCAMASGIKVAHITAAQADPDKPLLHVPWDDSEHWTFNELEEIDCGARRGR